MKPNEILEKIKTLIDLELDIKEEAIAELLFDKVVDKAMLKLVELIPTEIDNAFYESKKDELKALVTELVVTELKKLEDKANEAI